NPARQRKGALTSNLGWPGDLRNEPSECDEGSVRNEAGNGGNGEVRFSAQGADTPRARVGYAMSHVHQSLGAVSDRAPSLAYRVTSGLGEIRGGPRGAVSDVGDPTERLASLTAIRLPNLTTLYGSQSDHGPTLGALP